MNDVTGAASTFATAFCNKLAYFIDKQGIIMEEVIAAIIDPRQKLLCKFCHLFDAPRGTKWLVSCSINWENNENFVTDVTNNVIKYA